MKTQMKAKRDEKMKEQMIEKELLKNTKTILF